MEFVEDRTRMDDFLSEKSAEDIAAYQAKKNSTSIDGLPALD
jgi:hypothetical protein